MHLCSGCGKTFTRSDNLRRHERLSCKARITSADEPSAKRMKIDSSSTQTIKCCNKTIPANQINSHRRTLEHRTMSCTPKCDGIQIINSAFKRRIISYRVYSQNQHIDYNLFFNEVKEKILELLEEIVKVHKSVKVNMETFGKYVLPTEETTDVKAFNSSNRIIDESKDLNDIYQEFVDTMISQTSEFEEKDSGSVVTPGTISSPWTPVTGPPADTNGPGPDTKNLDVGDVSDDEKDMAAADAEGVWSPDIEQSFQEALAIYPPCGRRKIILSDEGKMYGRNELIARYIKLRTGKTRTRKQVSSHIQVLARRKLREIQAKLKVDHVAKEKALQTMSSMSSAQIVSATTAMHSKSASAGLNLGLTHNPVSYPGAQFWQPGLQPGTSQDVKPFTQSAYPAGKPATAVSAGEVGPLQTAPPPVWEGRAIATHKLRLVEFSAFMESQNREEAYQKHLFVHIGGPALSYTDPLLEAVDVRQIYDKFPEKKGGLKELYDKGPQNAFFLVKFWADLNSNIQDEAGAFYGVTSSYESNENMTITCSTKVCSFGKQVVEKVETEYARYENGRFVYRIHKSPMCEYMINFIHKLKHLPEKYMMNSVLENFTILQVVSNRDTQETLLCTAYVFEVSTSEHGAQHHIYRLVKD